MKYHAFLLSKRKQPLESCAIFVYGLLIALCIFITAYLYSEIFNNPSSVPANISVTCVDSTQQIDMMQLDPSRHRVCVKEFLKGPIKIQFQGHKKARFLMIRKGCAVNHLSVESVAHLRVSINGSAPMELLGECDSYSKRFFFPLQQAVDPVIITIDSQDKEARSLVIDEIGLYKEIPKAWISKTQYKFLFLVFLSLIIALEMATFSYIKGKESGLLGAIFCFFLALFIHSAILSVSCSSHWNRDLKITFASGTLQEIPGANLNYGLYMASSILQGKGPLIVDSIPWCRMPGYGYLLALAGHPSNLLQMAVNGIIVQSVFFACCLSFFFYAATRIMPHSAALLTSLIACLIAHAPPHAYYLQIESIMPAVVLLVLGTTCLFCDQKQKTTQIPLMNHLLLHLSFAAWFFLRTDIFPAWIAISLFLYAKKLSHWKYFAIPIALVICISLPWALFKMQYTGEFSMTTNSIGASMMAGMWEIPHAFIWAPNDASYYSWMESLGLNPISKIASNIAVQEVFRFWLTYPIYTFSLLFHKFLLFASNSDSLTYNTGFFHWWRFYLLVIIIISFAIKFKRTQTFLLSSLIFFNVPIFFQFYSSTGRFYHAPTICLFAAALPLILNKKFYQKLQTQWIKCLLLSFLALTFVKGAPLIDDLLIQKKELRYWSFFSEPKSTLSAFRDNPQKKI